MIASLQKTIFKITKNFMTLVTSQIDEEGGVELYGCWNGDEKETAEQEENIPASLLLDHGFWFRERGIYRITTSEQDGEQRAGLQAQTWEKMARLLSGIDRGSHIDSEQPADGKPPEAAQPPH